MAGKGQALENDTALEKNPVYTSVPDAPIAPVAAEPVVTIQDFCDQNSKVDSVSRFALLKMYSGAASRTFGEWCQTLQNSFNV